MYAQADIRNPVSDASIAAHHRWVAVESQVENLVKRRQKSAPAVLVEMLHRGPEVALTWRALSTGMVNSRDKNGTGGIVTFAGLCFARGRLDILLAVHAAGVPVWLQEIPRLRDPPTECKELGFPLPRVESPQDWLRELSTYTLTGGEPGHVSLFRIAVEPISKHTPGFLEFAYEVDPTHRDVESMRERSAEGYAMLTDLRMRKHIERTAAPQPHGAPPASSNRRARAAI